jgi:hypothetical protein
MVASDYILAALAAGHSVSLLRAALAPYSPPRSSANAEELQNRTYGAEKGISASVGVQKVLARRRVKSQISALGRRIKLACFEREAETEQRQRLSCAQSLNRAGRKQASPACVSSR